MKRAQTSALIQSRGFKFHPYTAMSKLTNLPVSSVCPQGRSHEHLKVSEDKAKCLLFTHTHPFFFPSFPLFRSTSLDLSSSFSYPASNPSANPGSSSFRISPESPLLLSMSASATVDQPYHPQPGPEQPPLPSPLTACPSHTGVRSCPSSAHSLPGLPSHSGLISKSPPLRNPQGPAPPAQHLPTHIGTPSP